MITLFFIVFVAGLAVVEHLLGVVVHLDIQDILWIGQDIPDTHHREEDPSVLEVEAGIVRILADLLEDSLDSRVEADSCHQVVGDHILDSPGRRGDSLGEGSHRAAGWVVDRKVGNDPESLVGSQGSLRKKVGNLRALVEEVHMGQGDHLGEGGHLGRGLVVGLRDVLQGVGDLVEGHQWEGERLELVRFVGLVVAGHLEEH